MIEGHEAIVVVQMFGKQMQENIAASNISENPVANTNIAGAESSNMENSSKAQKISDQMKLNALFKNNAPTLIGWFSIFGLAVVLILIDVAALIHKKHKPFFLEHKTHGA